MISFRALGILTCARTLVMGMLAGLALGLQGAAAEQADPDVGFEVRAGAQGQPSPDAPAPPELQDVHRAAAQLEEVLAAAQARLEEMSAAARAAAEGLHAQLQATSREKDHVAAQLAETERELAALAGDHEEAQARIASLTGAAEQAQATIAQLSEELVLSRDKIAIANSSRSDAEARLVEAQKGWDGARSEAARIGEELIETRARLAAADAALAEVQAERDSARAEVQAERDSARAEIDLVRAEIAALLSSIITELQPEGADVEEPSDEPGDGGAALDRPQVQEMAGQFEAVRDANVRSGPNAKAKRIGWVKKGEIVLVTGQVVGSNWYRVDGGEGKSGYVFADLLRRHPSTTSVAALRSSFPAPASPLEIEGLAATGGGTAGEALQECVACPELVIVTAGSFAVGTEPGERVTIDRPFAIGRYEVTVAQWLACVEAGGCEYLPETASAPANSPVRDVSWDDAREYVAWLSGLTGQRYRLPSEAEWEYAARGGTTSRFWCGDALGAGHANCADCGGAWERAAPAVVGSYPPNPFGLYDTSGSVMEWTADCWRDDPEAIAYTDPATGTGGDCAARVLRGGSWRHHHGDVTSGSRFGSHADRRAPEHGLRVARDLN